LEQTRHLRDLSQGGLAHRHASGRNQRGQVAAREFQAFAKPAPVLAFKLNEPMRDMIFVEEIVDQVPIARAIRRDDAQADELAVAQQALAPHDECVHDGPADPGQLH
jgi:hypothetical protein